MELQETRMSDDKKGSDLDIFEGLGKKSSGRTSAAPPPPPGSGAHVAAKPSNSDMKRTLMGIPGPAPAPQSAPPQSQSSASMKATQVSPSRPPPPPGRNALADLPDLNRPSQAPPTKPSNPPSGQMRASQAPVAPSTRPTTLASTSSQPAQPLAQPRAKANGGQLDMDWEDDEGDTHIFDKEASQAGPAPVAPISEPTIEARPAPAPAPSAPVNGPESRRPEHANMDDIMSAPPRTSSMPAPPARVSAPPISQPPPMPAASASQPPGNATLSGAFGALGQTNGKASPTSAAFRSGPPPSQSMRSAPPPPPGSLRNPSTSTAPMPPPPPPGQTTTAPMHMPMPQPPSAPPPMAPMPSAPPPVSHHPQSHGMPAHSQAPMPHMPPPSRAPNAMEATAMVPRPQPSKAPLVILMLLLVAALVGGVVFMMMPRSGTLVVNVADAKGGAVQKLEVTVDGKVVCSQAPCILKDVASGVHQVSVTATGYDTPAPRAVTIEGRKDATLDFSLSGGKGTGGAGTGFKVGGNQPGVKVIVDGVEKGALPQEIRDLEPGSHTLRFVGSDRYAPLEKTINVAKDEVQDLSSIQLKVVKGKAMITLGTPGAKVYLVNGTNRKEVPQFPIAIDFDPNEKWQLEAKKDGFDDFSQPISFDDGQAEKQFNVTLNAKGAHPAPVAQPATQPVVAQPATPATKPAGFLKAEKPAEEPATKPEPAAKKEPAAAAGGSGEAFLNINSLPASTVVLDGKPLGATPRLKVQVSPGSHTILFINSELSLKKSITVQVGAGETKAAFAKLRD